MLTSAERRAYRTRNKLKSTHDRLRLSVFRSAKHIYAQIIDDTKGITLVTASSKTIDKVTGSKTEIASLVGRALAVAASAKGVKRVVFDRGPYKYHGRVAALAQAAREGGLDF